MRINFSNSSVTLDAAAGDSEPRISGIAAPYGVDAEVSTGQRVRIMAGALPVDGKMPRLVIEHDTSRVVGVVDMREETDAGMLFSARIADTAEGRDLIALLKMQALDSVSVGLSVTDYEMDGKTMLVKAAAWEELSVVYQPAFPQAQITQIAASNPEDDEPQPDTEENNVSTESTPVEAAAAETPIPTIPVYATARKDVKLPTAVEYLSAAIAGGSAWHEMSQALRAAAPDVVTTDTPGILPTPIIGPVYNNFVGRRPVVDAIGAKAMPAGGKIFIRPEVTTHTSIGASLAEMSNQSGTFVVFNNQVTKQIFGGYVNVSEADLDWSDPAVLSLILEDMSRIYANATDNYAADQLLAGCSQSSTLTDPTSATEWVSDIYDCASTILTASNGNLPTHLFLSPNMFQYLGSLSDGSDRPLFPQVGPMNAFGTMSPGSTDAVAFGLRVVVDRNFAADTVIVGDASGFECYEQQKGAISLDSPSTLSRTLAFRGYFATLMIDATKFVKLT
jgi:HK97 family phage prohead protease